MAGTMKSTTQDLICTGYSKVGATAGWTVGGGAVNIGRLATCPASLTATTGASTDIDLGAVVVRVRREFTK